jgi:hypothetical protein
MGYRAQNILPSMSIVGNCPAVVDRSKAIDGGDWVTRFNNTEGFGSSSGSKISELVLVSRGGQAEEWIRDPEFINRRAISCAQLITLVFPHTDDPGAECWFDELSQLLQEAGKSVTFINDAEHSYARETLTKLGAHRDAALSSGFVYTHCKLRTLPIGAPPLHIFGFSFDGWEGHAWSAEAEWFRRSASEGRVRVHPVPSLVQPVVRS